MHDHDLAAVFLPISKSNPASKGRGCWIFRSPWRRGEDDNGAGCRDDLCYGGESLRGDEIEKGRMGARVFIDVSGQAGVCLDGCTDLYLTLRTLIPDGLQIIQGGCIVFQDDKCHGPIETDRIVGVPTR